MSRKILLIFLFLAVIALTFENPVKRKSGSKKSTKITTAKSTSNSSDNGELNDYDDEGEENNGDDDDDDEDDSDDDDDEDSDDDEDDDESDEDGSNSGLEKDPAHKDQYKRQDDDVEDFFDEEFDDEVIKKLEDGEYDDEGGGTGVPTKKWTKTGKFVNIPYFINKQSGYSKGAEHNITTALERIEARTCIRFKPFNNEKNHIEFMSIDEGGCKSPVGMRPDAPNQVKIDKTQDRCVRVGTIMHEIIHTLGFGHMHAHSQRDNFVDIHWDNLDKGRENKNFYKYNTTHSSSFGTKYDFYSVMHYPPTSKGKKSITPKAKYKGYEQFMGQRYRMSDGDVERLNNMYECDEKYRNDAPDEYDDYYDSNEDDEEEDESEEEDDDDDDDDE